VADLDTTVPSHSNSTGYVIPVYNYSTASCTLPLSLTPIGTIVQSVTIVDTLNIPTPPNRGISNALNGIGWAPNNYTSGQQDYRVSISFPSGLSIIGFSLTNTTAKNNIKNIGVYSTANYSTVVKSFTNGNPNDTFASTQMFTFNTPVTSQNLYFHIIPNSSTASVVVSNLIFYTG
jgi:hypothetical protein